jgi:hypothetical protein
MTIQIPDSEAAPVSRPFKQRVLQPMEQKGKEHKEKEEQCHRCGEEICWCSAATPSREQKKKETERKKRIAQHVKRMERDEKRRAARQERLRLQSAAIMAKRYARIERAVRMYELRKQHAEQTKQLKENPMTWIERPYLFGRFETLLSVLRGREAFSKITDAQVVALMPAYAVWLWTATQEFEVSEKLGNTTKHVINRWQLMNNFVDSLELHHK